MSAYVPPRPDLLSAEVMPAKATWRWWEALIAALLAWLAGALASLPLVIILKPDATVEGGLSVVEGLFASPLASEFRRAA